MSHVTTITTEVRDPAAVRAACVRLKLPAPTEGTTRLFDGTNATGLQVQLPDWQYPVVCDCKAGALRYDNFGGRWGEQRHLDAFLCAYAAEKAKIEARKRHQRVTEQVMPNGAIRLTIHA